jgi:menaquinol-cytochrome c reductase iron-sulfur subunit
LVALCAAVTAWPLVRSLLPNVLYEPPKKFKIGAPGAIPQGVTFLDRQRVYVFRDGNSYHAISGICTHLGCTVKFSPYKQSRELTVRKLTVRSLGEFHCPCHGSKFQGEGTNFSGPAPRPLKWHALELSPADGQLVVDVAREVDREFRLVV